MVRRTSQLTRVLIRYLFVLRGRYLGRTQTKWPVDFSQMLCLVNATTQLRLRATHHGLTGGTARILSCWSWLFGQVYGGNGFRLWAGLWFDSTETERQWYDCP